MAEKVNSAELKTTETPAPEEPEYSKINPTALPDENSDESIKIEDEEIANESLNIVGENIRIENIINNNGEYDILVKKSYQRFLFELQNQLFRAKSLDQQRIVANYTMLSLKLRSSSPELSDTARLGLRCLKYSNFAASKAIYEEIDYLTSRSAALLQVLRGLSLFFGVTIIFVCIVLFLLSLKTDFAVLNAIGGILYSRSNILLSMLFGSLGSAVSIMLRMAEFELMKNRSKMFLRFTGAFLPIIGAVFGAVIAALLDAKILNISLGEQEGVHPNLFIIVGFLSGFSERFAKGLLENVEAKISGSRNTTNAQSAG